MWDFNTGDYERDRAVRSLLTAILAILLVFFMGSTTFFWFNLQLDKMELEKQYSSEIAACNRTEVIEAKITDIYYQNNNYQLHALLDTNISQLDNNEVVIDLSRVERQGWNGIAINDDTNFLAHIDSNVKINVQYTFNVWDVKCEAKLIEDSLLLYRKDSE